MGQLADRVAFRVLCVGYGRGLPYLGANVRADVRVYLAGNGLSSVQLYCSWVFGCQISSDFKKVGFKWKGRSSFM